MTTLILGYRAIQGRVKSINLPQVNWKLVYILGILICFLLLTFYVLSINQLTQGTYLIKNYNKKINTLSRENKSIGANLAEVDPLNQIHNKARELGFENTLQIKYVEILDNSLASAQ